MTVHIHTGKKRTHTLVPWSVLIKRNRKVGIPGIHLILNEAVGISSLAKNHFKTWFLAIETWQCLIFTIMALRKRYRQYALAWRIQQFFLFSSWHCDFQVPHTSCLDAKNRFPQGWAKSRRQCILQISKDACTHTLRFSIFNAKGRDKMLLIKVNMIKKKSLFRFFETTETVSKHYHWQKTLMLYVTGGIKTPLLQSLVSEQWAWFTNREERQRGRLIWSQSNWQDQSGSFSIQENGREEEEGVRGGGWNGGIEKWHLWSGDLTWGNTINH